MSRALALCLLALVCAACAVSEETCSRAVETLQRQRGITPFFSDIDPATQRKQCVDKLSRSEVECVLRSDRAAGCISEGAISFDDGYHTGIFCFQRAGLGRFDSRCAPSNRECDYYREIYGQKAPGVAFSRCERRDSAFAVESPSGLRAAQPTLERCQAEANRAGARGCSPVALDPSGALRRL